MKSFILDLETAPIDNAADYLEPVTAPANYSKPDSIAKYIAEETPKQLSRAALDIDLNQIICLGVETPDGNTQVYRGDKVTEREMLEWLWAAWGAQPWEERQFVTFNGLGFDLLVLLRRSLYLGVKAPNLALGRYKHPQVVDVMKILSNDDPTKRKSLSFYLNRFNWPHRDTDITGAQVGECYRKGEWDTIANHCRMDVEGTAWLARRIGAIK